ncbi:MAG: thiamine pyrophosphate-dependent dehydrogenase E1 component subunit alpha [Verrucomicrobia bacterium]|nr:thiamine pyrophosphate-dependent dehydrogenase E1 component subunit alpha [Verrucomicrobiota bacterium]
MKTSSIDQLSLSTKQKNCKLLFKEMLRIRLIEEAIAERYNQQNMRCPVHLSIGQEAVAVGVCKAALHSDYLISTHRAHAHYLAKGGDLKRMIAEIYGKATGCCGGRGGSMHLIDQSVGMMGSTPIVGGSIPVGVGYAFASHLRKEDRITIIFFGEGTTEEGVFAESINFASLRKLPVLFVCENNLYSVYSPLNVRQPDERDRVGIVRSHGIWAKKGFGNDVEEVLNLSTEAVQWIRQGNGPAFLEFDTYRHREHCGPNFDNDIGYRTPEEFEIWKKKCPISLYGSRIDPAEYDKIHAEIKAEIEEAFHFAETSPFPQFNPESESPYAH